MYNQLTREQRYAIYLGIQEGKSQRAIARQINVSPSTVSREIRRNSTRFGHYSWSIAQENAEFRQERCPGNCAIDVNVLREALRLLRSEDWSPRQISGHLALSGILISHESIYSRIRSDESGELRSHCRHGMKYRRHIRVRHKTKVRNIPDRVSIHDRPPEAAISLLLPYRKNVHTITTDNGSEFRNHRRIADALNAKVYFADSYASWQKGAIENANKLIRQYIPKGTDFNLITDDFIYSVQLKINRKPREKLNFSTPKDEFFKFLS